MQRGWKRRGPRERGEAGRWEIRKVQLINLGVKGKTEMGRNVCDGEKSKGNGEPTPGGTPLGSKNMGGKQGRTKSSGRRET